MTFQSHADFVKGWGSQVHCPDQFEPGAADAVWAQTFASDPVGATWGPGGRRAPHVIGWGFNLAVVSKMTIPTLMVSGQYDGEVAQPRVHQLYNDLGSSRKVFIDLACSSHNAIWEKNHLLLFKASREWLTRGTVDGLSVGELRKGY